MVNVSVQYYNHQYTNVYSCQSKLGWKKKYPLTYPYVFYANNVYSLINSWVCVQGEDDISIYFNIENIIVNVKSCRLEFIIQLQVSAEVLQGL